MISKVTLFIIAQNIDLKIKVVLSSKNEIEFQNLEKYKHFNKYATSF